MISYAFIVSFVDFLCFQSFDSEQNPFEICREDLRGTAPKEDPPEEKM